MDRFALILRVWQIGGGFWQSRKVLAFAWVDVAPLLLTPALTWTIWMLLGVPSLAPSAEVCRERYFFTGYLYSRGSIQLIDTNALAVWAAIVGLSRSRSNI